MEAEKAVKIKRGSLFMLLGMLLILGAGGLTLHNYFEENTAAVQAERVAEVLEKQVIPPSAGQPLVQTATELQEVEIDERAYIGVLEIPALELSLPVQADWSLQNLKTSPCRYVGSALTDDMVIAGHNYRRHFGALANLEAGTGVWFTDVNGHTYAYEVTETEVLDGSDVEGMLAGDWDLTLFTCTMGGRSRVTVRCMRSVESIASNGL